METKVLTLTDFLLARIAEDEVMAAAVRDTFVGDEAYWRITDPGRWLAECEAKRRIVDEHERHHGECDRDYQHGHGPCPTLTYLAAVYADHPDYRDEWKP